MILTQYQSKNSNFIIELQICGSQICELHIWGLQFASKQEKGSSSEKVQKNLERQRTWSSGTLELKLKLKYILKNSLEPLPGNFRTW